MMLLLHMMITCFYYPEGMVHTYILYTYIYIYIYIYIDEFKKFAILKKGIGIESQNLCKQFNDQKTM